MGWFVTGAVDEFLAEAGEFLRAEPGGGRHGASPHAPCTRAVGRMVRIGPVCTPPPLRGRGYAGGATAAVSQAALDTGATQVVLYTDLANPTSNALYERLGYRPVENRIVLSLELGTGS
jgi:GNAT superfamily N-acetyltransferase